MTKPRQNDSGISRWERIGWALFEGYVAYMFMKEIRDTWNDWQRHRGLPPGYEWYKVKAPTANAYDKSK